MSFFSRVAPNPELPVTLSHLPVDAAMAGDHIAVPGSLGFITKIWRMFLVPNAPMVLHFQDGGGLIFTGHMALAALFLDFDGEPHFVCGLGKDFIIHLHSNFQIGGAIYFTKTPG